MFGMMSDLTEQFQRILATPTVQVPAKRWSTCLDQIFQFLDILDHQNGALVGLAEVLQMSSLRNDEVVDGVINICLDSRCESWLEWWEYIAT